MNPRNSLNLLMHNFETANRGHWAGRRALQGIASCVAVMSALVLASSAYAEGDLVVQDPILSRGIYEHEPADIAKSFEPSDERAYAAVQVLDGAVMPHEAYAGGKKEEREASAHLNRRYAMVQSDHVYIKEAAYDIIEKASTRNTQRASHVCLRSSGCGK